MAAIWPGRRESWCCFWPVFSNAPAAQRDEFGRLLAVFAESVAETNPGEGAILAGWADLITGAGPNS